MVQGKKFWVCRWRKRKEAKYKNAKMPAGLQPPKGADNPKLHLWPLQIALEGSLGPGVGRTDPPFALERVGGAAGRPVLAD